MLGELSRSGRAGKTNEQTEKLEIAYQQKGRIVSGRGVSKEYAQFVKDEITRPMAKETYINWKVAHRLVALNCMEANIKHVVPFLLCGGLLLSAAMADHCVISDHTRLQLLEHVLRVLHLSLK